MGRLLSRVPHATKVLKEMIGATLQERIDKDNELGKDWEGRPVRPHPKYSLIYVPLICRQRQCSDCST